MAKAETPSKPGKAKAKAAKAAQAAPKVAKTESAPPEPRAAAPGPARTIETFLSPEQRQMVEALSANLARAAVTAQGAIAEAALRQVDRPAALSPDPFHVAPALTEVMGHLAAQPDRLLRAQADLFARYMDLWESSARRMTGEPTEPVVAPGKGDKRFSDPDWATNPMFDVMKQSYLLSSNWLNSLVSSVEG
ncbi:MAG: poly(R)-hydroxyalkanoic acid synthase, class, partial [Caulobacter sp.]|nr:poly(R)-hydroxyalkanoic acid synthase, class [Caulobacter sp.]